MNHEDYKILEELNKVNETKLGVILHNGYYLTYSFKLELDGNVYYINMEIANGKYISKLKELSRAYLFKMRTDLKEYTNMLGRLKFCYKIVKYDDINFIYVFNQKYKNQFNDNDLN